MAEQTSTDRNTAHAPESVLRAALGLTPDPWTPPETIGTATVVAVFAMPDEPVIFLAHRPTDTAEQEVLAAMGKPTRDIEYVVGTWDRESPEWTNGRYYSATDTGIGTAWRVFLRKVTELAMDTEGDMRDAAHEHSRRREALPPGDYTASEWAEYGDPDLGD